MTPPQALQILVSLLGRLSLSPVEHAGAQVAVNVLKDAVEPKNQPPAPANPFVESVVVNEKP